MEASPDIPKSIMRYPLLKKTLLEIFAITFGVILAFMLNEWRVDAKQDAFVKRSLSSMEQELNENYERVMKARDYHLELYPDIVKVINGAGDSKAFQQEKFRGMQPPQIQTAAYEIGIQSAIFANIPLEDAKQIVTAYSALKNLEDLHRRYSSAAFSQISNADAQDSFPQFLSIAFMDFLYAEEETMIAIQNIVEKPSFERWWEVAFSENTSLTQPQGQPSESE